MADKRGDFFDDTELEEIDTEDKEVEVEKDEKAEPEIELVSDPVHDKQAWDADKIAIEDDDDKNRGARTKKRINQLRAAVTEASRQRDQHANQLSQAVEAYKALHARTKELEGRVASGTTSALEGAAAAQDAAAALAEKKYRDALAAGDSDVAAKANSDLAEAKARSVRLKEKISEAKESAVDIVKQQPQQQQEAAAVIPQKRLAWFKANPWFDENGDDDLSEYAIKVHRALTAKGVTPDSDSYFDSIDRNVRNQFPERFGVRRQEATASTRGSSDGDKGNRISGNKIRLSTSEYDTAKKLGLTTKAQLSQYAKEIMAREKEGK